MCITIRSVYTAMQLFAHIFSIMFSCITLSARTTWAEPSTEQRKASSTLIPLAAGVFAGSTEALVNTPLSTIKNMYQMQKDVPWKHPQHLWTGITPALMTLGCIIGTQNTLNKTLAQYISSPTLCSALTGMVTGATLVHAVELIIGTQHSTGLKPCAAMQRVAAHPRTALRAMPWSGGRETFYTAGYLGFNTECTRALALWIKHPYLQQACVSALAGTIALIASHPFDTVKTKLIHDLQSTTYRSGYDTIRRLSAKDLYKGFVPRFARGMIAMQYIPLCIKFTEKKLHTYATPNSNKSKK